MSFFSSILACLDGTCDTLYVEDEQDLIDNDESNTLFELDKYQKLVEINTFTNICHKPEYECLVFNDKHLALVFRYLDMNAIIQCLGVCRFWFIHLSNDKDLWTMNKSTDGGNYPWKLSDSRGFIRDWCCIRPIILNTSRNRGATKSIFHVFKHRTSRELFIMNTLPHIQVLDHAIQQEQEGLTYSCAYPTKWKLRRDMLSMNFNSVVLGVPSTGKTSLIRLLKDGFVFNISPTFANQVLSISVSADTNLTMLDMAREGPEQAGLLQFLERMDGLIYVIDGTDCDLDEQLEKQLSEFYVRMVMRGVDRLFRIPILFLVNKCDAMTREQESLPQRILASLMKNKEEEIRTIMFQCPIRIQFCSTKTKYSVGKGIEWFVNEMRHSWINPNTKTK